MQDISHRLRKLLGLLNSSLSSFSEAELAYTPAPGQWSKKEILGHLIDSAANNHRRFVLSQLEPEPLVITPYDQDQWVALSRYQQTPAAELLQLWTLYNRQIVRLLENLPPGATAYRCEFDNGYSVTLRWLAEDYVMHMEHHVHQILNLASA
ncbi:DinB family protein [Hymenobacter wooponensis]|uniref:DinB family protein n=1 Tax=Hymenobacter wooponensis TaxID=1525360 RepID=A0A4Z0MQV5_9BACT|nr:DinB family protein [Hymenobacter wooponensis]TGD81616.1 DinB family protein [Hymenobacter wooponensis]